MSKEASLGSCKLLTTVTNDVYGAFRTSKTHDMAIKARLNATFPQRSAGGRKTQESHVG